MKNTNIKPAIKPIALAIAAICLQPGLVVAEETSKNTLNNIVVTAQNSEQSAASVTGNLTVITREDIEQGQYQTFADVMRRVPGVSVNHSGGIGQQTSIFMRGVSSGSGSVLLLVDGVDQSDANFGGITPEQIQLNNIERIEVLKGPQSGIWGASASGGVINIITRPGSNHLDAFVEAGSYNTKTMGANLGLGNEQIDLAFSLFNQKTDGYSAIRHKNRSHNDYEKDGFEKTAVSMKFGVNFKQQHRVEALVKTSSSENEYDYSNPDDEFSINTFNQQTKGLQYKFKTDRFNSRVYLTENQVDTSFSEYSLTEAGLVGDFKYIQNGNLGFAANQKKYQAGKDDYTNKGFALSNRNQIGDNLYLDQALRYDEYDKFKNATTGRVGIKNYFADTTYLAASYGTGYNAPSLYQAARQKAGITLKPEEVKGYEVAFGSHGASITYFERETEDLVDGEGNWPNDKYFNKTGKTTEKGVEFEYQQTYNVVSSDISFNYTWLEVKNEAKQLLSYRPEHQANFSYQYFGFNKTRLGFDARYLGENYSADGKQGEKIDDYAVVDLQASYAVNKNFDLQAKLINAFDENYYTNVDFYDSNYVYSTGGRQVFIRLVGKM